MGRTPDGACCARELGAAAARCKSMLRPLCPSHLPHPLHSRLPAVASAVPPPWLQCMCWSSTCRTAGGRAGGCLRMSSALWTRWVGEGEVWWWHRDSAECLVCWAAPGCSWQARMIKPLSSRAPHLACLPPAPPPVAPQTVQRLLASAVADPSTAVRRTILEALSHTCALESHLAQASRGWDAATPEAQHSTAQDSCRQTRPPRPGVPTCVPASRPSSPSRATSPPRPVISAHNPLAAPPAPPTGRVPALAVCSPQRREQHGAQPDDTAGGGHLPHQPRLRHAGAAPPPDAAAQRHGPLARLAAARGCVRWVCFVAGVG